MHTINTIKDFTAAVHTALSAAFPERQIEPINVTKNNDVHLTGMKIMSHNNKVAPAIYMEPYFNMLKSGNPLEEVIIQIVSSCRAALSCTNAGIGAEDLTDFAYVKDKICYKLVNKHMNSELLTTVPHRDYLDLSIVYYIRLAQTDNGLATLNVTDSLAHTWGVDEETLFSLASSNTPLLCRGIVLTMDNVLDKSVNSQTKTYDHFDFTCSETHILPMYVATNTNKTYGASVILYAGLLDAAAEKLGSFYALPSSVHEFMFIPDTFGNAEYIKQMVKEINAAEVPEEEVLSDNIYHYDSRTHELKIAV